MSEENDNVAVTPGPEPETLSVPLEPTEDEAGDTPENQNEPDRIERRRQRGRSYAREAQEARERAERAEQALQAERERVARLEGRFEQMESAISNAGRPAEVPHEVAALDIHLENKQLKMDRLNDRYAALRTEQEQRAFLAQHGEEYKALEREVADLRVERRFVQERVSRQAAPAPQRDSPAVEYLKMNYSDVLGSADGKLAMQDHITLWKNRNPGKAVGPAELKAAAEAGRAKIAGPGRRQSPTTADRERFAAVGRSAGEGSGGTVSIARTADNVRQAKALYPGLSEEDALKQLARIQHKGREHTASGD